VGFCDLNVGIMNEILSLMSNKYIKCGYYNFYIGVFLCLWKYHGVIILHMYNFNWLIKVLHHKTWLQINMMNRTCKTLY